MNPQGTLGQKDIIPLRKAYEQAVREGAEQFKYRGMDVLTAYAKYVLEYLDLVAKGAK